MNIRNIPKSLTLPATALIPSVSMALGTNLIDFDPKYQDPLKGITAGLLLTASIMLFPEILKGKKKTMAVAGVVTSLALINISSHFFQHPNASTLTSLYFDAVSDGVMLGALLQKSDNNFKKIIPLIIPMSIEMALTGSAAAKTLETNSTNKAKANNATHKANATLAALILAISIVGGKHIGKYLNEEFVMGFGGASMLWLALHEFLPSLIKNPTLINNLSIYVGIIAAFFME